MPVYIRLDLRPRSAGLRVVRVARRAPAVRYFGPYLGGLKVRLAVSALQRVLPLAYAAEGLTGWSRDMARVRGVGPGDYEALVARATAVLLRDPEAVARLRTELVRRRDRAAGNLAFEAAARLQEEIAAAEWVTAEQKVTKADPVDVGVYGWAVKGDGEAGGVLVSCAIRAGGSASGGSGAAPRPRRARS